MSRQEREMGQTPEFQGQIPTREQRVEFPTTWEGRLNSLLQVVNMPAKMAVMFYLAEHPGFHTSEEIAAAFSDTIQGTEFVNVRINRRHAIQQYCQQTLIPHGCVVKTTFLDVFGKEEIISYAATDEGIEYVTPAMHLALFYEEETRKSLYEIMGQTLSRSNNELHRAPTTRSRIALDLAHHTDPQRTVDIAKRIGLDAYHVVGRTLTYFKQLGLVDYDAENTHTKENPVSFGVGSKPFTGVDIPVFRTEKSLSHKIYGICQDILDSGGKITNSAIYEELVKRSPRYIAVGWLRKDISSYLSLLTKNDLLTREAFKGGEIQSSASLTDSGWQLVNDFLFPLVLLCQDDRKAVLDFITQRYHAIGKDSQTLLCNSLNRYYPLSRSARNKESEEVPGRIIAIIGQLYERGDIATLKTLAQELGRNPNSLRKHLYSLLDGGEIVAEFQEGMNVYSLPKPQN